ncbi:MAG: oxidative damage protection protein [gamma proteobacterium symbiont of Bathyaustriella thionipta]|nr:oxidative damage protection protein [gamma proteobacterium symbiont of Bathyaustriella thionipta]
MSRIVNCVVLNREAEGLEKPPYPGDLGQRIYEQVSAEGWKQWLERLTIIINENGMNTADINHIKMIEQHMLGFLFKEGNEGQMPSGYKPQ